MDGDEPIGVGGAAGPALFRIQQHLRCNVAVFLNKKKISKSQLQLVTKKKKKKEKRNPALRRYGTYGTAVQRSTVFCFFFRFTGGRFRRTVLRPRWIEMHPSRWTPTDRAYQSEYQSRGRCALHGRSMTALSAIDNAAAIAEYQTGTTSKKKKQRPPLTVISFFLRSS